VSHQDKDAWSCIVGRSMRGKKSASPLDVGAMVDKLRMERRNSSQRGSVSQYRCLNCMCRVQTGGEIVKVVGNAEGNIEKKVKIV